MATERFLDLCIMRAVGTALYAKDARPAEMGQPFREALHAASGGPPPLEGENPASSM